MNTRTKRKSKAKAGTGGVETSPPPPVAEASDLASPEPVLGAVREIGTASDAVPALEAAETGSPGEVPPATLSDDIVTPEELRQDEAVVERVEHLAKEVGWILIAAGVVGIIMPGVLGTPFLIAGAAALWPGNRQRFQRWREGHSPRFFHGSMKQINRFLDDLDRRYPKDGQH